MPCIPLQTVRSGNMLMSLPALAAIAAETSSNTAPDFYVFDFSGQDVNTEQLTLSANFGPQGSVVEGIQAGSSAYLFSAPAGGEAVPEPTTSALALLGLSGLALRRRRK